MRDSQTMGAVRQFPSADSKAGIKGSSKADAPGQPLRECVATAPSDNAAPCSSAVVVPPCYPVRKPRRPLTAVGKAACAGVPPLCPTGYETNTGAGRFTPASHGKGSPEGLTLNRNGRRIIVLSGPSVSRPGLSEHLIHPDTTRRHKTRQHITEHYSTPQDRTSSDMALYDATERDNALRDATGHYVAGHSKPKPYLGG